MRFPRLFLLAGTFVLACVTMASAADTNTSARTTVSKRTKKAPFSVEETVEKMRTGLNLSEEQVSKITGIIQQRVNARADYLKKRPQSREERMAGMLKIDNFYNEQIRVVLTPQQRIYYDMYMASVKEKREERMAEIKKKREMKKAQRLAKKSSDTSTATPERETAGD